MTKRQPLHTTKRPANRNSKKPVKGLPPGVEQNPSTPPSTDNTQVVTTDGPGFGEPRVSPDPAQFTVKHGSDSAAYSILDSERGTLKPRPFPVLPDVEPRMSLADAIGSKGPAVMASIQKAGQVVFHALGDTGNTSSPTDQNTVTDKLIADFNETDPKSVPSFCYNLGDVVYSFGEASYYYDQFYDPYRDYPAPIFAIAGNHDGMVSPYSTTPTLQAFVQNFCTASQDFHRTPEAGGLVRTAGRQPGVYFTLEVDPYVRILGLYSNCLEDPGVISTQTGASQTYSYLTDAQVNFLVAGLKRANSDPKFKGAIIIAVHHPPYTAIVPSLNETGGKHGGSPLMLAEIDGACERAKVWPHAVLSGHAHNYQRFTRHMSNRETPFLIAGNGGHAHKRLTKKGTPALRAPVDVPELTNGSDQVTFENYDDGGFGYLRILVNDQQLRIEYHPASDGQSAKTPDDSVTVDLKSRKLVHFKAS